VNGLDGLVITKLDVLDNIKKIKICTAYKLGRKVLEDFPTEARLLKDCKPVYETFDGWMAPTDGIKSFKGLPAKAQKYVRRLEELTGVKARMISVGAERDSIIFVKNPFA
jgi:adenylosuccinate synthase